LDEIVKIDLFGEEFRFKPDGQVKDPDKVAQYLKDYIKEAEGLFQNKKTARNRIAIAPFKPAELRGCAMPRAGMTISCP